MNNFGSEEATKGVRILVASEYVPSESDPKNHFWFYIYHVTIQNEGEDSVQLLSRHWIITNGEGEVEHVRGAGVVGEQPVLSRGQSFSYTSACPLNTAMGTMHGTYQMKTETGELFDAKIAPFLLAEPNSLN